MTNVTALEPSGDSLRGTIWNISRFNAKNSKIYPHHSSIPSLSIPERLFLAKLKKAKAVLGSEKVEILNDTIASIRQDIASLPEKSVLIKEKARSFSQVKEDNLRGLLINAKLLKSLTLLKKWGNGRHSPFYS